MEGLVNIIEQENAARIALLEDAKAAYNYLAQERLMKELCIYVGKTQSGILGIINDDNAKLNEDVINKIFEYESMVRLTQIDRYNALRAKRLKYQMERANSESALGFTEQSLSYNNEVRALANVL